MPLQKQQIPVQFAGGLDTKTDDKQVVPGKFLSLENAVFTNPGKLQKRNGLNLLSQTIDQNNGDINEGQALSTFQDQLLLFTGAKAYSRLSHNEKWTDKGNVSSVINTSYQIVRNGYQQSNVDGNKISGVECYAWEDSRGGLRYSIVDSVTGNFIVSDQLLNAYGEKPKVLALNSTSSVSSQFCIIFSIDNSLYLNRIYTNTLSITPVLEEVCSDLHEDHVYNGCSALGTLQIDGVFQEEFNNLFITYAGRFNSSLVYTNPRTYKITADNIQLFSYDADVNASTIPLNIAVTPVPDASLQLMAEAGPTPAILWQDGYSLYIAKVPYYIGPLTSQAITLPSVFEIDQIQHMALIWDGQQITDQINFKLFFEFNDPNNDATLQYCRSADVSVLIHGEITAVSTMDNVILKKGIGLYSKPFYHNNNIYIVSIHSSEYQPTYFILNSSLEVVSKANENLSGGLRTSLLSEVILDGYSYGNTIYNTFSSQVNSLSTPVSSGIFKIPLLRKGKLESESNTIFSFLGVSRHTFDFVSQNKFISAGINNNLYVVGGVLQNYDGNTFTEAGFYLYPEDVGVSALQPLIIATTVGTASSAQVSTFELVAGSRIRPGDYFLASSANNVVNYFFWFRVDGVGTAPNLGAIYNIGLQVNINSYYTPAQVAEAVQSVFNLIPEFSVTRSNETLTITNISNGVTNGILSGSIGLGNVDAGTYSYICIWKYIDNAGRIHRSTTSIPQQFVLTSSNKSISIKVPILSPTSKNSVILEVYRTENNGSIYRRVTSLVSPIFNVENNDPLYTHVVFIDTNNDSNILANEILYTTGAVLDNSSPPPCSLITTNRSRLFVAGLDNKNLIQYTKLIDPSNVNDVAGFNDALYIELDPDGGDITALAAMDEKLIIFKETKIFYISGDGPTNTGEGAFSLPQLISTDVGCNNPNSVVLMPNGLLFNSPKGIYLLGRDLQVSYLGAPVERFNSLTISSSILLNNKNQVRFTTEDGSALVYDYYINEWTTFTNYEAVDCDVYNGEFVLLRSNGKVMMENNLSFKDQVSTSEYQAVKLVAETTNLSLAQLEGFQRVYRVAILGEYKGAHTMQISFAYNFDPEFSDSATFDATTVIGSYTYGSTGPYGESNGGTYGGDYLPYLFRIHLAQQKCTSIRIKLEDIQTSDFNEGLTISGISLEVGAKKGPVKLPENRTLGSS